MLKQGELKVTFRLNSKDEFEPEAIEARRGTPSRVRVVLYELPRHNALPSLASDSPTVKSALRKLYSDHEFFKRNIPVLIREAHFNPDTHRYSKYQSVAWKYIISVYSGNTYLAQFAASYSNYFPARKESLLAGLATVKIQLPGDLPAVVTLKASLLTSYFLGWEVDSTFYGVTFTVRRLFGCSIHTRSSQAVFKASRVEVLNAETHVIPNFSSAHTSPQEVWWESFLHNMPIFDAMARYAGEVWWPTASLRYSWGNHQSARDLLRRVSQHTTSLNDHNDWAYLLKSVVESTS